MVKQNNVMVKQNNVVVKKYLEQHSLVESNILSFNDFIANRIQRIVDELNSTIGSEEVEIRLGKVRLDKPNIIEADGSTSLVTPTIAKLRNLTYSAPIYVELTVKYEGQTDSSEVEIGRIPVMVRSIACNTYGMSRDEKE